MREDSNLPITPTHGPTRLSNTLKTGLLLAVMTALVLELGRLLGGGQGMMLAGVFVIVMNGVTYWFSDRIALALHRARPLPREEAPWLYEIVERLCGRARIPVPPIYLIPTNTPNAFATGRSPDHAAVAVTAGILQMLDPREMEGVLAHELSHVKNRDTLISTVAATMAGIISQAARIAFWFGSSMSRRSDDDREGSALGQIALLLVAPFVALILQLAVSRAREYQADESGAQLTGDPGALADALGRLEEGVQAFPYDRAPATASLFIVNPLTGGAIASLFSTHPPLEKRIARLRAMQGRAF